MSRAWSLLVLAALLSACAPPIAAQPSPKLADTSWVVTELSGKPTLPAAVPTIQFSADQVSGFSSCNRFSGSYRQSGSTLSFSQLAMTAMACMDAGVMEQESAFSAALAKVASVRSAGSGLELVDSSGAVLAKLQSPSPAAPDRPLEKTTWQLDSITVGQTASSVVAGSTVTLTFADGHLTGKACNSFRASAEISGSSLKIGPVMSTKMACREPGVSEQESRLFQLLPTMTGFAVKSDRLTLTAADGSALEFVAK
ncbi:heat shock protein HslJ [Propionicimonas paludicola]|uniref:Heat shock protein HslJ n=1 Tax=Propionicimonas paludicola TaxID=185243 RepID=A0A2A9CR37_9ACTN|nr:META domain-containing protein [Propionicimonas paludicola]PFG16917.1 heat shock protein HslJ [Propionicimonas paludicola]